MSRSLIFTHLAQVEYTEAVAWYEAQRRGLGKEFEHEVNLVIDRIREDLAPFQRVTPRVRKARVRRFPYSLYFAEAERVIGVLAVFHAKRNPMVLLQRLKGSF